MQYMGSKRRVSSEILPIILSERVDGQLYVEPFVGGANMIEEVCGPRIGFDSHPQLIELLKAMESGWIPPESLSESEYQEIRKEMKVDALTGFAGFLCSFGSKWFGGYAKNNSGRDYVRTARNSVIKQSPKLKGCKFFCSDYKDIIIPEGSIAYCDPPYAGSTGYGGVFFDSGYFWEWVRSVCYSGSKVFVSEYSAPSDFVCIWESEIRNHLSKDKSRKSAKEKLFVHESQYKEGK